jgi:catechol 2,3-dioxygenase-like lactoylglutathione lyase family enzyme
MAARRPGLRHPDVAACPCPNLLDRLAGPRVRGLHRLEEVQNVLRAHGSPESQEPMVGVRKRPPTADGDEAGVAILREDHFLFLPRELTNRRFFTTTMARPDDRGSRCNTGDMTIKRLDHVSVVVDDLAAAIAFFTALGMTIEGEMPVEGPWVDRVNGLESVQVDIVMMRTPDGHGRLELTKFRNPKLVEIEPAIAPPNTLGLRSVMFTVESVDDTVARLRANGAELVGEVAQYEDRYRLCYMRGPAGIIVALAEELF